MRPGAPSGRGGGRARRAGQRPCPQLHPAQDRQGPAGQEPAKPVPQGRAAPL